MVEGQVLIGLSGYAGAGKTTVARALADAFGGEVHSFATPLKDMVVALLQHGGMTSDEVFAHVYGDRKEEPLDLLQGRTARYAMQTLGTEWGRGMLGERVWTHLAMEGCRGVPAVVFDDVRFPTESTAILDEGGWLFNIVRPELVAPLGETYSHASEQHQPGTAILNDDTPEAAALKIVEHIQTAIETR